MSWLYQLSARGKQMVIAAVFLAVILLLCLSAIQATHVLKRELDLLTANVVPRIDALLQADRDLYQALIAERSLLSTPSADPRYQQLREAHAENIQQAGERMAKVNQLALSAEAQQIYARFSSEYVAWQRLTQQVVDGVAQDVAAATALSFGDAGSRFDSMRDQLDKLTEVLEAEVSHANDEGASTVATARLQILLTAVIGSALAVILAWWLAGVAAHTLIRIRDRMAEIASGEGDLTQRLQVQGSDEAAQLASTVNSFIGNLGSLIRDIQRLVTSLNGELAQVQQLADRGRAAANEQQGENNQVATAVTEMAASVEEVARNAADAAAATQRADADVERGRKVVGDTLNGIDTLARNIEKSAEVIRRVEDGSRDIGSVMDVISSIAEQTNLLALNAAIEAARAGEQGRGFAVVADEVRTLAQRTQNSTQQIRSIIEKLQNESRDAVRAMSDSQSQAQQLVGNASGTGSVLAEITQAVNLVSGMNTQIATAAEEQATTADQISENVVRIKQMAEETDEIARQVAHSTDAVRATADQISGLVARFRV